jgi:hypothetical protein
LRFHISWLFVALKMTRPGEEKEEDIETKEEKVE